MFVALQIPVLCKWHCSHDDENDDDRFESHPLYQKESLGILLCNGIAKVIRLFFIPFLSKTPVLLYWNQKSYNIYMHMHKNA